MIIGLSECSLLFPIGTLHTNSFLCHPFDCKEVVCFWTLQYFRYVMIVGAIWWRWCTPAAGPCSRCCGRLPRSHDTTTAADVGGANLWPPALAGVRSWPLLTPTTSSSPAVTAPLPSRWASGAPAPARRRRLWRDLPHASTGVLAGRGRRLPSGLATLSDEQ